MDWHTLTSDQAISRLESGSEGLSDAEAAERLKRFGPNKISVENGVSPLSIFISQFQNLLVVILVAAALVSVGLSLLEPEEADYTDSLLIFGIVIANAIFGFVQEYKAEKTIEALTKMSAPMATVLRGGKEKDIDSALVVPGDVILLKEGDKAPADSRLIECFSMEVDESALTGESVPSGKSIGELKGKVPLAERSNMVFMDSVVTRGHGKAVVTETGLRTEVGSIAREISEAPRKITRFQVEIEDVGRKISFITLAILVVIVAVNILLHKGDLFYIFLVAVALGVAAIPEGLPAVVTLALSIATRRMLKQNALMRRLSTIQDLGSVDVICTDKTGTLTENVMTVRKIFFGGAYLSVGGKGLEKEGEVLCQGGDCPANLEILMKSAILCNDAREVEDEHGSRFKGDPTEVALLLPAYKAGFDVEAIRGSMKRLDEIPFSSERKMMSTLNRDGEDNYVFVKGALEVVLERCTEAMSGGRAKRLTDKDRAGIIRNHEAMASEALRVIALAYKPSKGTSVEEDGLVFLGLMGMIDPPRQGVKEAISDCRRAGIRVIMITGDNKHTAEAVGRELGFKPKSLSGDDLDSLSETGLKEAVGNTDIFARTSPHHKVLILKTLKQSGHIVAMTGDGVNDAAAMKNAEVGIAMGIRGTEVTKQASDIIILDDNFTSIRNAIAEGRGTFDNIRKFVTLLLGANTSEVLAVFIASITALGLSPKIAIQLLWINLLTDGLPALALGVDRPGDDIMKRKPRPKAERILNRDALYFIVWMGVAEALLMIALYSFYMLSGDEMRAYTIFFTGFVVLEMLSVYLVRWRYKTRFFSNKWLHLSVMLTFALQLAILYTELGDWFMVVPLELQDWAAILIAAAGLGAIVYLAMKLEPFILRR